MSKTFIDEETGKKYELQENIAELNHLKTGCLVIVEMKKLQYMLRMESEESCQLQNYYKLTEPQAQAVAEAIKTTLTYITTKSKYEPDTDPMDNSVQWARQLIWGNSE